MFFGRGLLSIYNAAMQSPCTVADDFDDQLAAGQKCGLVDSQFPIFHWFEWLFIDPNPLITLYEKRNKVCSGEHIFVHLSSSSNRFEKSKDQDSTCMVEVSGMITTFDYVAALIALLVSECPEGASIKAATDSCFGWFYPLGWLMFEKCFYWLFLWTWCSRKKRIWDVSECNRRGKWKFLICCHAGALCIRCHHPRWRYFRFVPDGYFLLVSLWAETRWAHRSHHWRHPGRPCSIGTTSYQAVAHGTMVRHIVKGL